MEVTALSDLMPKTNQSVGSGGPSVDGAIGMMTALGLSGEVVF